jgi:type IV secretion system protein VirD4
VKSTRATFFCPTRTNGPLEPIATSARNALIRVRFATLSLAIARLAERRALPRSIDRAEKVWVNQMRALTTIAMVFFVALSGLWLSTELVASELHYAPRLGPPLLKWGELAVYPPWAWLQWEPVDGPLSRSAFRQAHALTTGSAAVGALLGMLVTASRRKRSAPSHSHGSSRWATTRELGAAGLLRDGGVVLCQTADASFRTRVDRTGRAVTRATKLGRLVRHDGPEHVFCFAPTRSGKGVGLVVPTLLTWNASVLVYDIKKENWALTAGWRRQFSRVWRFEPTSPDSVRFNPLMEIRRGDSEVRDVQNVADILVDPNGEKDSRDHWQLTAHALLCGAILHVLYAEGDKTLSGVAGFLSDPSRKQTEVLERMLTTAHLPVGPHPTVSQVAREMLNKSENELSGVYSTAMACLGLYRDPVVARNTAESDFRIADLVAADTPVSLYLVVPPSDLTRTRPIIRLLLNQIGRRLTESMQAKGKHRLLLLLDEFPSLGRLEFFESALAFMAGYGLKAFLVAQSLNQLEKAYGQNNSILDNCHVRVTYAANDDRTARRVSDLLGQATEKRIQKSWSGRGIFLSNRTESEQEYGRPLLMAGEVTQLPADDSLLLMGGSLPYRGKKVRYFLDPRFQERAVLPAPDTADEQRRELLPRRPGEWEGLVAACPRPGLVEARREGAPAAREWAEFFASGSVGEESDDGGFEHASQVDDGREGRS